MLSHQLYSVGTWCPMHIYNVYNYVVLCTCIIKPWRMHEGYSTWFVCESVSECVCLFATTLVATYLVYMSKVWRYTVSCRLLKMCIVWTSLKTLCSGGVALFGCHDDRRLGSFSTKNTNDSGQDYSI